jgi:hypothetical protein
MGSRAAGDGFRRASDQKLASGFSAFRAQIDDPVGFCDEVEVMFDDEDGVAGVNESMQDVDESCHVSGVKADSGFLEDEQIAF